ncbi:uncharacterized protein LOC119796119 isoform X2 [Cyprinodon tularosa]|uniref:uncharacterized protein LOC119796119 isoform X2 n=1 Tax=Cyprinodon tularosa TaxID=77115 RepID=UPI0018E23B78|nr:uncharacterized protein LOC119796119 isoform X2 [Cyprinodon tularosa]
MEAGGVSAKVPMSRAAGRGSRLLPVHFTDEDTLRFIQTRTRLDFLFTGKRNKVHGAWQQVIQETGVEGVVTPTQAAKKWDNLKSKYKELTNPNLRSSEEEGRAATWPWFEAMHEAIGERGAVEAPHLIASCGAPNKGRSSPPPCRAAASTSNGLTAPQPSRKRCGDALLRLIRQQCEKDNEYSQKIIEQNERIIKLLEDMKKN